MYALGLIIFQLWYNFSGLKDKKTLLLELKTEGKFPADFNERVGSEAEKLKLIILNLLHKDELERKSAKDLLKLYTDQVFIDILNQIVNPKKFEFKKLMQYLFNISNPPEAKFQIDMNLKSVNHNDFLVHHMLNLQIEDILKAHEAIRIDCNPLIEFTDNIFILQFAQCKIDNREEEE